MKIIISVVVLTLISFSGSTIAAEAVSGSDTASSSSMSPNSGSRLLKSPEDIKTKCFAEAGLSEDDPSHAVTQEEFDKVLKCSSRYIKK